MFRRHNTSITEEQYKGALIHQLESEMPDEMPDDGDNTSPKQNFHEWTIVGFDEGN